MRLERLFELDTLDMVSVVLLGQTTVQGKGLHWD